MNLSLYDPLREFALALRLHEVIDPSELELGIRHLEAEAKRIALDAHTAMTHPVPLAEAVHDVANFPHLARIHTAVDDLLTLSLPPPLVEWLMSLLAMPEPPAFDAMRAALVVAAAAPQSPDRRALARFMLFEGVRLNLVLLAKWHPHETYGVGLELRDLDAIAEARVDEWFAEEPAAPEGTRPFHVIVAAAAHSLGEHAAAFRAALAGVQQEFVEGLEMRARVEELLSEMDVRDAILFRNQVAPALGEQRLSVELLQERHWHVLAELSRDALDQRAKRARDKARQMARDTTGESPKRRRIALLDLLRDAAGVGGAR